MHLKVLMWKPPANMPWYQPHVKMILPQDWCGWEYAPRWV
jgi:hypothetical protein